jgi:hypothetical protein
MKCHCFFIFLIAYPLCFGVHAPSSAAKTVELLVPRSQAGQSINNITLLQTATFDDNVVRFCYSIQNRTSSFILTSSVEQQITPNFIKGDGSTALRSDMILPGSPAIPPPSEQPYGYREVSQDEAIQTCFTRRLTDFRATTFTATASFRSWLRPGAPLANWVQARLTQLGPNSAFPLLVEPLRSNQVLLSNRCFIDITSRRAIC